MVPVALSLYLGYGIIVLLSLDVAVFNNVFMNVYAHSNAVWKLQRYLLVIECESRPILPSPFIIISHIIPLVKFIIRKCSNKHKKFDQGLKVFLHDPDLEKLHDFEEECMEIFHREKQQKAQSTDEYSVKQTANRLLSPPYFQSSSIPVLKQRRRNKKPAKEVEECKTKERDWLQEAEENVNEQLMTVVSRRIRQLSLTEPGEVSELAMDALKKMETQEDEELSDYDKMPNVERNMASSRSQEEIKSEGEAALSKLKFVRLELTLEPLNVVSMEMSLLTLKEDEEGEGDEESEKRKSATEEEVISFSADVEQSSTRC